MSNINSPGTGPGSLTSSAVIAEHPDESSFFSLNVLRGIAVLGLLVVSIWEFGGLSQSQQYLFSTGTHGGNYKLFTIVSVLLEGKMLALLALVFGAGIVIFMKKKQPVPLYAPDAYIRRQMWLMAFGAFNAFILLWPADILFPFGVVGLLLFAFWRLKTKGLLIAALVCTLIYTGKQYWNYADDKNDYKKYLAVKEVETKFKKDSTARAKKDSTDRTKDTLLLRDLLLANKKSDSIAKKNDTLTKKQAGEKSKWEGMVKSFKYDSSQVKADNKAMRNRKYTEVSYYLMTRSQQKESAWLYRKGVWDFAAMMLLGMVLLSLGFFRQRFSTATYLLTAAGLIIIGFLLSWYRVQYNNARLADYTKYVDKHALPFDQFVLLENMALAIGYASLVIALLRAKFLNGLWAALAATGRLAFTNYIMQSVICSFFFYGYGFSYFGHLTHWQLYFMVAEIIMLQVVFSILWLRYYTKGPVEWLWSCLVYRKWLPLKKTQTGTNYNPGMTKDYPTA